MTMQEIGKRARAASTELKIASTEKKNAALTRAARLLREKTSEILAANAKDMGAATSLSDAQKDRLRLDAARIDAMAKGVEVIAALPDPVGSVITRWTAPAGFEIERVRVPLGVIGIIYESRPNVTIDAAALCLKSGNACILRPGSESFESAKALCAILSQALREVGLPEAAIQMVPSPDRAMVLALLKLDQDVDVIIPRGGKSLIAFVQEESRVPVLAHLDGICHTYIDRDADLDMAKKIVLNAKMRRTGICGATETLLVDREVAGTHLKPIVDMLLESGCEVRVEKENLGMDPRLKMATEDDWRAEYLDAILSVKLVDGVAGAVKHIEAFGSHHTDCIVTENGDAAHFFLSNVDSAIVTHNASTQFADGGEFGMGAEIGIATGRLHARGPVGLEQLTTFKNIIYGKGHIRKP